MGIRPRRAHHPRHAVDDDADGGLSRRRFRRRRDDPGRDARGRRPLRRLPRVPHLVPRGAHLRAPTRCDPAERHPAIVFLVAIPLAFLAVGTDRLAHVVASIRERRRRRDWVELLPAGIVASRTVDLGDGRPAPTTRQRPVRARGHPRGGRRHGGGRRARDPGHRSHPSLARPPGAGLRRPPLHGGRGTRARSRADAGMRAGHPGAAALVARAAADPAGPASSRRDRLARMLEGVDGSW